MCLGPHISWFMLHVQSLRDLWHPDYLKLLAIGSPFSSASFHNSTIGVSCFCPLVGCKYLHLTFLAVCWVFWSAVMPGPFVWVFHSLSNSVRTWDLPLNWIPLLACHWTLLFLRLLSISIPAIPLFIFLSLIRYFPYLHFTCYHLSWFPL